MVGRRTWLFSRSTVVVVVNCDLHIGATAQTDRHSVIRWRLVTLDKDKETNATV